jgi:hypothetical protein
MKARIFAISAILLSLLTVGLASAQTATFGVSPGETFDYSYSISWTSTNPSATPPEYLAILNETTQIRVKVLQTTGSNVSVEVIRTLSNGTQIVRTGYINIVTADITAPYGHLIVRANINANEAIYPAGGNQMITNTFTKSYATGERATNHVISTLGSDTMTINYDKIKGIAVDYSMQMVQTSDGYTATTTEKLTNTNSDVWAVAQSSNSPASPSPTVPEFSLLMVPLLLAAASVVLLIGKRAKLPFKL